MMNDRKIRTKEIVRLILLTVFCLTVSALSAVVAGIDDFDKLRRILAGVIAVAAFIIGIYLLIFACRIRRDDVQAARALLNLHEEDLKNKFINRIYLPKAFWHSFLDEMRSMPLSDVAAVLRQARDEIARAEGFPLKNKKRMEKLRRMRDDTEKQLVGKILNAEFLYILEDIRTRFAVLAIDESTGYNCILIFYKPLNKSQYLLKVPRSEIEKYLFVAFTLRGAKGLCVYGATVAAEKFIPKIDYAKMDEAARPIKNPDLMLEFTKLALLERPQDWQMPQAEPDRYTAPQDTDYQMTKQNPDNPEADETVVDKRTVNAQRIKALWDEMAPLLTTARFLLPIKKSEGEYETVNADTRPAGKSAHIVNLKAGTTLSIPTLVSSTEKTRIAIPIFSDWYEFYKLYPKAGYDAWILKAADLTEIDADTFVLNAGSICYEISRRQIRSVFEQ